MNRFVLLLIAALGHAQTRKPVARPAFFMAPTPAVSAARVVLRVQRLQALTRHVRVNRGGGNISMAQQHLYGPQVGAVGEGLVDDDAVAQPQVGDAPIKGRRASSEAGLRTTKAPSRSEALKEIGWLAR